MTKDHDCIAAKIDAFYEGISGPSGLAPNAHALATLFVSGAAILSHRRDRSAGAVDVAAYIDRLRTSLADRDFFERGFDYRIEVHGDIAQVWSRYEASSEPGFAEIDKAGTNLIHLVRDEDDWRIASMVYQDD